MPRWATYFSAEEERRRFEAYLSTDTDEDAAELLGLPTSNFRYWRRSRDLSLKGKRPPRSRDKKQLAEAMELKATVLTVHTETKSDQEAANLLGVSLDSYRTHRRALKLEPKNPKKSTGRLGAGGRPKHLPRPLVDRAWEVARQRGLAEKEADKRVSATVAEPAPVEACPPMLPLRRRVQESGANS